VTGLRLWHGGVPGLRAGDVLTGGNSRRLIEGCAICEARSAGQTANVAGNPIDPPSARPDRLYVTTDRDYARHYASLYGRGDLYRVEPVDVGDLEPSAEDHFPTWTTAAARVLAVYDRAVRLTPGQRRALWRAWTVADAAHAATH
jgi:hypothetical protein